MPLYARLHVSLRVCLCVCLCIIRPHVCLPASPEVCQCARGGRQAQPEMQRAQRGKRSHASDLRGGEGGEAIQRQVAQVEKKGVRRGRGRGRRRGDRGREGSRCLLLQWLL